MGKPVRSLFLSKIEENHMEETNVTMTTEKTQGEPAAKEKRQRRRSLSVLASTA